jgi:hypothetical protein
VKKNASGLSNTPKIKFKKKIYIFCFANLGILFLGANLSILPILNAVKRPEEHVMERPVRLNK